MPCRAQTMGRRNALERSIASEDAARCVLVFHRVVDVPQRDHDISWASLSRTLESIGSGVSGDLRVPFEAREVVLTFDDGTSDHERVGEVLSELGLRGIFFVPAALIGEAGFLTPGALGKLSAQGHVVGSHGFTNIRLDRLGSADLRHELVSSKRRLQEILGTDVTLFAPPGGSEHRLLVTELRAAGYDASRSVRWGIYRSAAQRWRIPCVPVTEVTVSRGWVAYALANWKLPLTMRALGAGRALVPLRARPAARSFAHRLGCS